jgi:hypothetical protein
MSIKHHNHNMDLEKKYSSIIENLKSVNRALIKLEPHEIDEILKVWNAGVEQDQLQKILCIVDHTTNYTTKFEDLICSEISNNKNSETLIFLLGAAQKHIISASAKEGFPPSSKFMSLLKEIFNSSISDQPEVLEWLLRTVEQTGMKSILFKEIILKKKPGFSSHFNQHKKACKEIIELLERRWAPLQGSPLG